MRQLIGCVVFTLPAILGDTVVAQDVIVRQGIPYPLERDATRVVVKSKALSAVRAEGEDKQVLGARVDKTLSKDGDLALLEVDTRREDVEQALGRLRNDPDVELAAPLYIGEREKTFTVFDEAVVKFRSGVDQDARETFYADYGFEPLYEYPLASGRVICRVSGGQRERDTLAVVREAYFSEVVEHVSPGFYQEVTLTGECYDPGFSPGSGCSFMGPGSLDCPPVDPNGCKAQPACPTCECTRFGMTLPTTGCGDDTFSCELHQFGPMGIWNAWNYTRGNSETKILIIDGRLDRDHQDVGPQVALELEPSNVRTDWAKVNGSSYAVTLPQRSATPGFIYFYFVDPPNQFVSGASIVFHIDNLRVQESGPSGTQLIKYQFDEGVDFDWQSDFSTPTGSNHAFSRKTVAESGCASSPGGDDFANLGTHLLRIETTGAGNLTTHQIRVDVPGLQAGKDYYVTVDWVPKCGSGQPPFEGFVRFGIDGDQSCAPRFGGEMGRAAGEVNHGTVVTALACGADSPAPDNYGVIGVAPDCRAIFVNTTDALTGFGVIGDASALLAAGRAGASALSASVQLTILSDDYLDAYRAVASRTRNGLGAPIALAAGNDAKFVHGSWIGATDLATSVGALALVTPLSGPPYWTRGCGSSYGADIWVLDHRVFDVDASKVWDYETYGFTTAELVRGEGLTPGDFRHYDEVDVNVRRVPTSTSWCTPIVAGVYGLMLSRDPSLTREEANQILYHTAARPDAQGKIKGIYLDCALPGTCLGGVDPSPTCTDFPSDPTDASFVDPAVDIPFDPVTSRSKVFGYGFLDAEAAVVACDPVSPKRWPEPARAISVLPTLPSVLTRRVRVSWLASETNRATRGYDGYVLVRTIDAPLSAPPTDGTAPPAVGAALHNGIVVAKGEVATGTLASSYEDTSTLAGRRHYAIFYYRKLAGPQDYYYSFGKEARIVYSVARWKRVTTHAALAAELVAGVQSDDPTKAVVLFVDSTSMSLPSCLEIGSNVFGSPLNGPVWIVGDKGLGGAKTKLVVPAGLTGLAICGGRHLTVSGFTIEGGDIGLGVWKPGGATGGCTACSAASPRADEIAVLNCRFEENQIGLWLENPGDVLVQNCIVRATGTASHASAAGIYFPPRPDPQVTPNDHHTLYSVLNNTFDVANRPCLRIHMESLSSSFNANHRPRLQVFNNILRASGATGVCVEHGGSGYWHLSNWNDFVIVSPAKCGRIAGGASYNTLAAWQLEAMSDKHSIIDDPQFVNQSTGDYHIATQLSAAVNGGTTEPYEARFVAYDFDGWDQPRLRSGTAAEGTYRTRHLGIDIGADEYKSATQSSDADLGFPFLRGDADSNGAVQLNDSVVVLNYLFSGGPPPACFDAADADDSELLQQNDAVLILQFLFYPSNSTFNSLPPPHPFCGFDVWRLGSAAAPSQSPYHCGTAVACP